MNFTDKFNSLELEVTNSILKSVNKSKIESSFSRFKAIKIKTDVLMFNLEQGNYVPYVVEVTENGLVSDSGNNYFFSSISLQNLCQLADYCKSKIIE